MLEGRGTGARGGEIAAKVHRAQLEALGRKARARTAVSSNRFACRVKGRSEDDVDDLGASGSETFKFATTSLRSQARKQSQLTSTPICIRWLRHQRAGAEVERLQRRDRDYRGKILVMLVNDPPAQPQSRISSAAERSLTTDAGLTNMKKLRVAAQSGVILLHTDQSAGYPWGVVRTSNGSWRFDIAAKRTIRHRFYSFVRGYRRRRASLMKLAGQDLDALRARPRREIFNQSNSG
jgi:hypothetical protein